jgi:Secretion system C-terminal sorting domain
MRFLQILILGIVLSIGQIEAGPVDSVFWNKMITPHTLFFSKELEINDVVHGTVVHFNSSQDTLFIDFHVNKCENQTLQYKPYDTTLILYPTITDSVYHLMFRMVGDTNTVNLPCYNDTIWYWEHYIGHTSWPTYVSSIKLKEEIRIYPNPGENELNILIPKRYKIIRKTIIDFLGRPLISSSSDNCMVNISSLNSGFYYILIETTLGDLQFKFSKQ